jgi:glycosyltransferase involved in cell wall biosynthesis
MGRASICLNMIVKNESAVIERCLRAARPLVDAVVILDTGSTDNTVELIERFCASENLPCQVPKGVFENFEQARNLALKHCIESSLEFDYVLLIDADLILIIDGAINAIKSNLNAASYLVAQQSGDNRYSNVRLVKRDAKPHYRGVTHEALYSDGERVPLGGVWINDVGDGGSKSDKFERDLRLLLGGVAAEPNNERYWFYLARTYDPLGRFEDALATFEKRIAMGGWVEEVYVSMEEIAKIQEKLGKPAETVVAAFLRAWQFRPTRAEPLVNAARIHRVRGEYHLALLYAERATRIAMTDDILFVDVSCYTWRALDEYSIAAYWTGAYRESWDACSRLLSEGFLPVSERDRVSANRGFAMAKLAPPA